MNIKNIEKNIKKLNLFRNRWIGLYVFLILSAFFLNNNLSRSEGITNYDTDVDGLVGGPLWIIGLAVLSCLAFYERYLQPKITYDLDGVQFDNKFYKVMKYHAFPVREYMKDILKKYIPINAIAAAEYLIIGIAKKDITNAMEGIVILIVPFLVWQAEVHWFEYNITHRTNGNLYEVLIPLCDIFKMFLYAVAYVFNIMIWAILIFAMSETIFVSADEGNAFSAVIRENNGMVFGFFMLMQFVFSIMLLTLGADKLKVKLIQLVVVLGLGGFLIVDGSINYTKITGEKIVIVEDNKKTEYTFDDIEKCMIKKIDADVNECTIKLKDGNKIVFGDEYSMEYNDALEKEFKNVSDYVKWIESR